MVCARVGETRTHARLTVSRKELVAAAAAVANN